MVYACSIGSQKTFFTTRRYTTIEMASLRELARDAIRVVLEDVMREELDALIGVGWGESSRQQQRVSQRLLPTRVF
jgi:transposase-like protein